MKKIMIITAAAMSLLALGACSGNKCDGTAQCTTGDQCTSENNCVKNGTCLKGVERTYTGILPAADAEGIRYTLKLDYDDEYCKKGDYDLTETYLTSDANGYKDGQTFKSEGDFTVIKGEGADSGKTYLKLVSDKKDDPAGTMYFMVDSDSSITMVGADLQPAVTELNYTLKLVK